MLHKNTNQKIDLLTEYREEKQTNTQATTPTEKKYTELFISSHQNYTQQDLNAIVTLLLSKNDEQFLQIIPSMSAIYNLEKYCQEKTLKSKHLVNDIMAKIFSNKNLFWQLILSAEEFPKFRKKHPDIAQAFLQQAKTNPLFNKKINSLSYFQLLASNFPDLNEFFYERFTQHWQESISQDNDSEEVVNDNIFFWHTEALKWLLETYPNHAEDILKYLLSKKAPKYDYSSAKCLYHYLFRAYDFISLAYTFPKLSHLLMPEMQDMLSKNFITWTEWEFIFKAFDRNYPTEPAPFKAYANKVFAAFTSKDYSFLNLDNFNAASLARMFEVMPAECAKKLMIKVFNALKYYDNAIKLTILSQIADQLPAYSIEVESELEEIAQEAPLLKNQCQQVIKDMHAQNAIASQFDTRLFKWEHFKNVFSSRVVPDSKDDLDKELAVILEKKTLFEIKSPDYNPNPFNSQDVINMAACLSPHHKDLLIRKIIISCCPLNKIADEAYLEFFNIKDPAYIFFSTRIQHQYLYEIAKLFPKYRDLAIERLKAAIDYVNYIMTTYHLDSGTYDMDYKSAIITTYKMHIDLMSCLTPTENPDKSFSAYRDSFVETYNQLYRDQKSTQSKLFSPHWVNKNKIGSLPAAKAMEKILFEAVRIQENYLIVRAWEQTKNVMNESKLALAMN